MKKSIAFLFSFLILFVSCEQYDNDINNDINSQRILNNPKLLVKTDYGESYFNMSDIENGVFDKVEGYISTKMNTKINTRINLSKDYLESSQFTFTDDNTISFQSSEDYDDLNFIIKLSNITENSVVMTHINNGVINKYTFENTPIIIKSIRDGQIGVEMWQGVLIAVLGTVASVSCAIANINDSNNCSAVALDCPSGVKTYEFEGGACGGGDCNVECK